MCQVATWRKWRLFFEDQKKVFVQTIRRSDLESL
jgi:hypothetical protein